VSGSLFDGPRVPRGYLPWGQSWRARARALGYTAREVRLLAAERRRDDAAFRAAGLLVLRVGDICAAHKTPESAREMVEAIRAGRQWPPPADLLVWWHPVYGTIGAGEVRPAVIAEPSA
jgi:hypothetical protein